MKKLVCKFNGWYDGLRGDRRFALFMLAVSPPIFLIQLPELLPTWLYFLVVAWFATVVALAGTRAAGWNE